MPNPKRRHSHQRTAKRRTNYVAVMPEIAVSRYVGATEPYVLLHNASPDGVYKGRQLPGSRYRK